MDEDADWLKELADQWASDGCDLVESERLYKIAERLEHQNTELSRPCATDSATTPAGRGVDPGE